MCGFSFLTCLRHGMLIQLTVLIVLRRHIEIHLDTFNHNSHLKFKI